ncbi:vesicle-associated membrane protein 4 isoform X2 [Tupanvirus soda lake]|uniref:Vesicle-associated membrane protein 4 isoform X2 n=2 Tax=Tupanvirus TaxID=2094720 RepID=A0A6N1NKM8_9VIRU|nr:vesicle-associated membrane protein 4 isoform X2 [Tupanvirus soda lake]QKU34830.1 vesicle-associated membrane protein 4 isoform X2 [Tupanvirus soda lake]
MSENNNNNEKIQFVQIELDETKDILKKNIYSLLERGEKIENIHVKTEELVKNSEDFKWGSKKLKDRMCWQNYKITIMIVIIILAILAIIIIPIIIKFS